MMKYMEKHSLIRTIYLYLFACLGLVLLTIGGVRFLDMGLKAFVFTKAEQEQRYDVKSPSSAGPEVSYVTVKRHRDASLNLSLILIGLPLYLYHWRTIKKDTKKKEDKEA